MDNLNQKQIQVIKFVQERKSPQVMADNLECGVKTVYRIMNGLSNNTQEVPIKWRTDKVYLLKKNRPYLNTGFVVAPEGFRILEADEIEVTIQENVTTRSISDSECELCGFDDIDVLEEHHIVPRSYGGSDREENLIILCSNCHSKIHAVMRKGFGPVEALNKVAGREIKSMKEAMMDE